MSLHFRQIQHLLPRARAWHLAIDRRLRQFFEGLGNFVGDGREFVDEVYLDLFPETTRFLDEWEGQFALPAITDSAATGAFDDEAFDSDAFDAAAFDFGTTAGVDGARRTRLLGAWRALGGQSPRYIQDTLQGAGFPVFVHDWWDPGTFEARNPIIFLGAGVDFQIACGEPVAQCGENAAQAGFSVAGDGYPLVNKNLVDGPEVLPALPENEWPYVVYIGGQFFPGLAEIPALRRNEFEELCLKICPAQLWLGILVEYT